MLNGDEDIEMGRIPDEADGEASGLESVGEPPGEFSLTTRVVRGGAWVFAGKVAGRGLQVIKLVVLARLLVPEDFGLFGITMLAMAAIETLTTTGFEKALIQRRDDARAHLDTAWTVQILRGLVIAALLFAGAPLVAWFFDEPRTVPLLRVLCLTKLLGGFRNIGMVYWRKELEFSKEVLYGFSISFVSAAVGILLAFVLRNVWVLVWSSLAGAAFGVILSYAMQSYRPRPNWNTAQARELFGYGKWLLGNSILTYLAMKADKAILGYILGAASLGLFTMAERISHLIAEVSTMTNSVMMPAYAKVQNNRKKLGRGFLKVYECTFSLIGPMTLGLIIVAPPLVRTVLGHDWEMAIRPLQILSLWAFLIGVVTLSAPVFLGTGHPYFQVWKSLIRGGVTLSSIIPLTRWWGISGASVAALLGLVAISPFFFIAMRIVGVNWRQIMSSTAPGLVLCLASAVGAGWGLALTNISDVTLLTIQMSSGFICVLITAIGLGRYSEFGPTREAIRIWAIIRQSRRTASG